MRIIRILNLDTENEIVLEGQTIHAGEYYQIQNERERERFASSQTVQQYIFADPAKIKIGDGDQYFDDPSEGHVWLESGNSKVNIAHVTPFADKVTPEGYKLFKRKHGFVIENIPAGGSKEEKFNIPYGLAKILGAEIISGFSGDYLDFFVYDNPDGDISGYPDIKINQFGFSVYVCEGFYEEKSQYDADLIQDMKIGVKYYNTGSEVISVYVNLDIHEVVGPT